MTEASTPKCLGFIGGLGVGATVHYYQELTKAHAARSCVPNLVMIHADVNRVLRHAAARETTQLAEYLSQLIHRLARAGAELAVIPAVTPHICASELIKLSPIPLPAAMLSRSGRCSRNRLSTNATAAIAAATTNTVLSALVNAVM